MFFLLGAPLIMAFPSRSQWDAASLLVNPFDSDTEFRPFVHARAGLRRPDTWRVCAACV